MDPTYSPLHPSDAGWSENIKGFRMKHLLLILFFVVLLVLVACSDSDNGNPSTPENHAPVIQSLTAYPDTIGRSGQSTITCIATDLDGDSLSYYWTCRAGSFSDRSGYEVSWQGVSQDGQYYISVTVSDGKSIDFDSVAVTIRVEAVNNPPTIPYNPNPRYNSSEVPRNTSLSWMCNDADGDSLIFDVFLGTNESLTSLISVWRDIVEFSVQPEELVGRQTYYWRVVARDSRGAETGGYVWCFQTAP